MSKDRRQKKSEARAGPPSADASTPMAFSPSTLAKLDVLARVAIPIIIGLTLIVMLWWTWQKWADLLVDYGRELYTPWQITEGRVLYRDIAAFYGPLSQYFNAALFEVFGVSMRTLALSNVAITIGMMCLLYPLLRAISSRLAAAVACLVFVILFAAAHHSPGISNYNFVTPYSHEAMHGLVLAVVSLYCLMSYQRSGRLRWVAALGFTLGLVFLTKPESFVAAAPAVVLGTALTLWCRRVPIRQAMFLAMVALGCALLPILVAWLLLCTAMPANDALRGVLGSWPFLTNRELTSLPFFKEGMGTDNVPTNVVSIASVTGKYLLVMAPALLAGIAMRWLGLVWRIIAAVGAAIATWVLMHDTWDETWFVFVRPMPLFLAIAGVIVLVTFVRHSRDDAKQMDRILRLVMIVWSSLLLLKMILLVRIEHYGFILAMPATMMLVIMLIDWIPNCVKRWGGSATVVQVSAIVLLGAIVRMHIVRMSIWLPMRTVDIGTGGDRIIADYVRGPIVAQVLSYLSATMGPDQTLLVMPEGVMINYQLRRESPVPFLSFLPPDLIMFDEQRVLDDLRAHPPDFIAVVHRPVTEYGKLAPGYHGYAELIMDWILRNYDFGRRTLFGKVPYLKQPGDEQQPFGIMIVPRKADAYPPSSVRPPVAGS